MQQKFPLFIGSYNDYEKRPISFFKKCGQNEKHHDNNLPLKTA